MSIPSVEGGRDATIIAFPLQRVSPPASSGFVTAEVISLATSPPDDAGEPPGALAQEPRVEPAEVSTDRLTRRAHNVAVHALAGRGQSREEIERRLLSRDLPEEAVSDEIERLEGLGLINDSDLATDLVDRYAARQGLGRRAVAQKMRDRRIAPEIIAQALESVSDEDESARLYEVAGDRARALRSLPPEVAKRRLVAYLQRRGFRGSEIFTIVDTVLSEV